MICCAALYVDAFEKTVYIGPALGGFNALDFGANTSIMHNYEIFAIIRISYDIYLIKYWLQTKADI